MSNLALLPPAVRTYLRGYVLRGRRLALVRGIGVGAAMFIAVLLISCLVDRFAQLSNPVRVGLLVVAVISAVLPVLRPLLRLRQKQIDWLAVAGRIESEDDRFGQRLQTVASQLFGPGRYRGSDELLEQLAYDLDREAVHQRPSRLLPARRVAAPWLLLCGLLAAVYGLSRLPDINMPQLCLRFLAPLADLEPVTTTKLAVSPGDQDVMQGASATIDASIHELGGGMVWLHVAAGEEDGEEWQRYQMAIQDSADPAATAPALQADGALRFNYKLTSIDRDLRYYVTAGDARSRTSLIRVLRKPAVAEFRIRYVYPPHTGRPPLSISNHDGKIEAPTGTEAHVTIISTEPLKSALLTYAGETQAMTRPADDATGKYRQGKFIVSRDAKYELGMVSTREQAGTGPATADVKAMPDRVPVARIASAGQTLRISPRGILPISYDAIDDFGIGSLALRVQVGTAAAVELPIVAPVDTTQPTQVAGPLGGALRAVSSVVADRRHREGVYDFDLAGFPLAIGDVVTLTLAARDTSNQVSASDAVHVLVSPRSVGIDAYELVAELDAAALLAGSIGEDLNAAAKLLETNDASQAALASSRASRRYMSASSSAALIRRALIRGIGRDPSTDLSAAMMGWIDEAQVMTVAADGCFRELGAESKSGEGAGSGWRTRVPRSELIDLTKKLAASADRLAEQVQTASAGQRAAVIAADIENLAATEKRGPPKGDKAAVDRYKQSMNRLREEISSAAKTIKLQASAGDFKEKVKAAVERSNNLLRGKAPVDFVNAARDWSRQMQSSGWQPIALDERLSVAAQAEAVRPSGDLRIARDYNLAGRAAAAMEASRDRALPVPISPAFANAFVSAFEALQRAHTTYRRPPDVLKEDEQAAIATRAASARQFLEGWSGDAVLAVMPATMPGAPKAAAMEALALQAGAKAADGNYAAVEALDQTFARSAAGNEGNGWSASPAEIAAANARQATATAWRIESSRNQQQQLSQQTAAAAEAKAKDAGSLAAAQSQLAEGISLSIAGDPSLNGSTTRFNARDVAGEAYVAMQNRLAALPQEVAELVEAEATRREAADRTRRAKREVDNVPPDRKAAAKRMAEMAAKEEADAEARVTTLSSTLRTALADGVTQKMNDGSPAASAAKDLIASQLAGALKTLSEATAAKADKPDEIDRAAAEVRQAIDASQQAIVRSQEELALQDPLTSAKWYARAAADALNRKPPDYRAAERSQKAATLALSNAKDGTLRYASNQRMQAVRAIRTVASPVEAPMNVATPARSFSPWSMLAQEWRRLRSRDGAEGTGLLHQAEPPGFEAPLKAYFEALEKGNTQKSGAEKGK